MNAYKSLLGNILKSSFFKLIDQFIFRLRK